MQRLRWECFPVDIEAAGEFSCQVLGVGGAAAISAEIKMVTRAEPVNDQVDDPADPVKEGRVVEDGSFHGNGFPDDILYFFVHSCKDQVWNGNGGINLDRRPCYHPWIFLSRLCQFPPLITCFSPAFRKTSIASQQ